MVLFNVNYYDKSKIAHFLWKYQLTPKAPTSDRSWIRELARYHHLAKQFANAAQRFVTAVSLIALTKSSSCCCEPDTYN